MKIIEAPNKVFRGFAEAPTEKTFTIKPNAKAFKILSDSLYTDKIKAIIRELSCNALDSHIQHGNKDVPFDVQLPSSFEHVFRVRDYGTGLSEDEVFQVYTTYFESTKTDSNDFIGALGLGSKSPFCYTDAFSVTSWHGGWKKIYNAFINELGFPHIIKTAQMESSEPSGVEVKMSTKPMDVRPFSEKAADVFKYFDVVPNLRGQQITINKTNWLHASENVYIPAVDVNRYQSPRGCVALVGSVAYPIDASSLGSVDTTLLRIDGLHFRFDIGEVSIAASREALSMDATTIKAFVRKQALIKDELLALASKKIEDAPTPWEAWKHVRSCFPNTYASINNYIASALKTGGKVMYKGQPLPEAFTLDFTNISWISYLVRSGGYNRYSNTTVTSERDANGIVVKPWTVTPTGVAKIVINDIGASRSAIHKQLQAENCYDGHIIIAKKNNNETGKKHCERLKDPKYRAEAAALYSGAPAILASELKWAPKAAAAAVAVISRKSGIYRCDERGVWKKDTYNYDDGGVYIEFEGGQPVRKRADHLQSHWTNLKRGKIIADSTTLYGIPKFSMKQVTDNPKWVTPEVFVKAECDKKVAADKSFGANFNDAELYHRYQEDFVYETLNFFTRICREKIKFSCPEFNAFIEEYGRLTTASQRQLNQSYSGVRDSLAYFDVKLDHTIFQTKLQQFEKIKERYDLLFHLRYNKISDSKIAEYVKYIKEKYS
jgi:hypothetical protein